MLPQVQLATSTKRERNKKVVIMIDSTKNNDNYYNSTETKYQVQIFNLGLNAP